MVNVPPDIWNTLLKHRQTGGKLIAYMPTFRDYAHDHTVESGSKLDMASLGEFGARHNVLFLFKFHPYVRIILQDLPPNCVFCPPYADVYPLLRLTNALITDFSSVYFDYLLLNRPIHYFVHDKEEYELKDRKFMLDFNKWPPGHKSHSQAECLTALKSLLNKGMDDDMEGPRTKIRKILFEHNDDQAAVRCCQFIESMVLL